jgi:hypothetical protein
MLTEWYGGPLSYPVPCRETVPGMWATTNRTLPYEMEGHHEQNESMRGLRTAIQDCSPNDKAETVLVDAFEKCRRRQGIDVLIEGGTYWLVRKGYRKLFETLEIGYVETTERCSRWHNGRFNGCRCEAGKA